MVVGSRIASSWRLTMDQFVTISSTSRVYIEADDRGLVEWGKVIKQIYRAYLTLGLS